MNSCHKAATVIGQYIGGTGLNASVFRVNLVEQNFTMLRYKWFVKYKIRS